MSRVNRERMFSRLQLLDAHKSLTKKGKAIYPHNPSVEDLVTEARILKKERAEQNKNSAELNKI